MSDRDRIIASLREAGFQRQRSTTYVVAVDRQPVEFGFGSVNRSGQVQNVWLTTSLDRAGPDATPHRMDGRRTVDALVSIVLRREGALDVLGKRLAINRELQLGDAAFDDSIYIETDAEPTKVRELLTPTFRAAATALLELGVDEVALRPDTGRVTAARTHAPEELSSRELKQIATALVRARAALPVLRGTAPRGRRDWLDLLGLTLWGFGILGVAIVAVLLEGGDDVIAIGTSARVLGIVLGGTAAIVAFAWFFARGTSVGMRRFGMTAIGGALALVTWTLITATLW